MAIHQLLEAGAMAIHAEAIGEGEGHLAAAAAHHLGCGKKGPFGLLAVPQVTLQVEHLGLAHQVEVEVGRIQAHRGAQVGAHGALGIGGDQDQAAGRGGAALGRGGFEASSNRPDVVGEDRTELVVANPANEAGPPPQLGDAGQGVGRRST